MTAEGYGSSAVRGTDSTHDRHAAGGQDDPAGCSDRGRRSPDRLSPVAVTSRARRLRDVSPVALLLAAFSLCVDVGVVGSAAATNVRRCADGHSTLLSSFVPGAVLVVLTVVAVIGHDALTPRDRSGARLARWCLIALAVVAAAAISASFLVLRSGPELPCLD